VGHQPVPLAGDALGPLLGGWLLEDIPRAFFEPAAALIRQVFGPAARGGDSAQAIEQAFADLWRAVGAPNAPLWDQTAYLSLFYADAAGSYRAGMPLWLANGTDATTGNRVITTPLRAPSDENGKEPWPFRGARDFHRLMGADVSIATAINNTARFPYLEPFGEMLRAGDQTSVGSLVDGGYFENEGLQTALDLAEWLTENPPDGRVVRPIVVEATGDAESDVGKENVMTCAVASDGAWILDDKHSALQILAPLFGLYHVRGGHSAVLLRQTKDDYCDKNAKSRFVHFYLPADDRKAVPLNWVLSDRMGRFIWGGAFTEGPVDNTTELDRLKEALK
jgi:hypothetical protein